MNDKEKQDIINKISNIEKGQEKLEQIFLSLDEKINTIYDKIQDFEIVLDAAEILEDQQTDNDWEPYEEREFEIEDYENYDIYDDDDDEEINGY